MESFNQYTKSFCANNGIHVSKVDKKRLREAYNRAYPTKAEPTIFILTISSNYGENQYRYFTQQEAIDTVQALTEIKANSPNPYEFTYTIEPATMREFLMKHIQSSDQTLIEVVPFELRDSTINLIYRKFTDDLTLLIGPSIEHRTLLGTPIYLDELTEEEADQVCRAINI